MVKLPWRGRFQGRWCRALKLSYTGRIALRLTALRSSTGGADAVPHAGALRDRLEDRAHTLSAAQQSGEPGLAFLVQAPREASGTQGHHTPRFPITTTARDDQDERRALIPAPAFCSGEQI